MSSEDSYSCEDVFRRLDDYVDRELEPGEINLLERHLKVCEACLREYEFEMSVISTVKQKVQNLPAPPDLMKRISAALTEVGE